MTHQDSDWIIHWQWLSRWRTSSEWLTPSLTSNPRRESATTELIQYSWDWLVNSQWVVIDWQWPWEWRWPRVLTSVMSKFDFDTTTTSDSTTTSTTSTITTGSTTTSSTTTSHQQAADCWALTWELSWTWFLNFNFLFESLNRWATTAANVITKLLALLTALSPLGNKLMKWFYKTASTTKWNSAVCSN